MTATDTVRICALLVYWTLSVRFASAINMGQLMAPLMMLLHLRHNPALNRSGRYVPSGLSASARPAG